MLNSCGEVKDLVELNIASSSSVAPFIEELFSKKIFEKKGFIFNFIDLDSSQARKALKSGIVDFYVTDEDFNKLDDKELLREKLIAKDALLLIANSDNKIHSYSTLKDIFEIPTINDIDDLNSFLEENPQKLALIKSSIYKENSHQKSVYINDIAPIKSNFNFGNYPLIKKIKLFYKISVLREKNKYQDLRVLIDLLNLEEVHSLIDSLAMINANSNELLLESIAEKPIRIGVGVPLKNKYAASGQAVLNAVKLYVNKVNTEGGIQERELEIHACDDEANTKNALKAIDCAQKFVKLGVKAVIGHLGSEASIATSSIYQEHNIIQVSPTAVHPGFTHQKNNRGLLFRTATMDFKYSEIIYDLLQKKMSEQKSPIKLLVIHNDSLYVKNILSLLISKLRSTEKQKSNIRMDYINSSFDDWRTSKKLIDLDFDLLLVLGPEFDLFKIVSFINSINESDKRICVISETNTYSPYLANNPEFGLSELYIAAPRIKMDNEEFIDFRSKYEVNADGVSFDSAAVHAYIAAKALANSMEAYYTGTYSSIAEAMHKQSFNVFGEKFSFNEMGDREDESMTLYKFREGSFSQ